MSNLTVPGPLVFVAISIAAIFLLLAARRIIRTVIRFLGAIWRVLVRMLRPLWRLVRPIAIAFSLGRRLGASVPRPEAARVAEPLQMALHLFDTSSLAQKELGDVPTAISQSTAKEGLLFCVLNANNVATSLPSSISLEEAKSNLDSADAYYNQKVEYKLGPSILFEDAEEALIIRMFKKVDLPVFYVLAKFRQHVSRNMFKAILLMTGMLVIFPALIMLTKNSLDFNGQGELSVYRYYGVCAISVLVLSTIRVFYAFSASSNGRNFNTFMQTYFSYLSNQFKSASTAFVSVRQEHSSSIPDQAERANTWFLNIYWLSARQLFLELFVRNIMFQIRRNLFWYMLIPPVIVGLSALIYANMQYFIGDMSAIAKRFGIDMRVSGSDFDWSPMTLVPIGVFSIVYLFFMYNLLAGFWKQIRSENWLNFQRLGIKSFIEENTQQMVGEIATKRWDPLGGAEIGNSHR